MGFIMRTCSQFNDIKVSKTLFCSLVWNPRYKVHSDRLESVQRRFVRFLQYRCGIRISDYETRCRRFHILPLKERRAIADIIFLVKIAQNHIDSPELLSKLCLKVPSRTVRLPVYLNIPRCSTNYRQNSFFLRSAYELNKLVTIPELDMFNSKPNLFRDTLAKSWFDGSFSCLM
ncbi:hypothetical protein ABMA28_000675 [Loxostege sticticalis]|uniref:Maturase K n=1 Tax=Loxostege sticticalis TaxID=481309 RepID=A0ABD0T345_LOXSC